MKKFLTLFLCAISCISFSQNVLSTKDLKDATYRFRYITAQKNCPTCPNPKMGMDLTSDTLKKYVELNTKITSMIPATGKIPAMTFSVTDSSASGEILTIHTYQGKPVYQEAIYGNIGTDLLAVKMGIDKLLDITGWVGYTQLYTNGQRTFKNSTVCSKCDISFDEFAVPGQKALAVHQTLLDPPNQINRRFYLKFRFTKL